MSTNIKSLAATAAITAGVFAAVPAQAQTYGYYADHEVDYTSSLTGDITNNSWVNLSSVTQNGVPGNVGYGSFPGTGAWPAPIASQINTSVGDVGSSLGGATLNKLANGAGGGPYPAGSGIYYGGFSAEVNYNGGKLGVSDSTPIDDLATIVFQVGIGEAWTYDFLNHELPTLTLTYDGGASTVTGLTATYSALVEQFYNGTVTMPTGDEAVYINQHALQWDLTAYADITSFEISFNGVQHAQLYGLTLTQSNVFTDVVSPVPEPGVYAMMLAGLGLVGGIVRRRRRLDD